VLAADNVIDFVREAGAILMTRQYSQRRCALYDETARGITYITSHSTGSAGRALWPFEGCAPDP
jgi:hypothetical protein